MKKIRENCAEWNMKLCRSLYASMTISLAPGYLLSSHLYSSHFPSHLIIIQVLPLAPVSTLSSLWPSLFITLLISPDYYPGVTTGPSLHPVFSVSIFIHHTSHLTWLLSRCYHWAQSPPCLLCGHLYSSHFPSHLIIIQVLPLAPVSTLSSLWPSLFITLPISPDYYPGVTTGPSLHPVFSVAIFIYHTSHLTWLLSRCYHWAQSPPCLLCGHLYLSHFPSHLIIIQVLPLGLVSTLSSLWPSLFITLPISPNLYPGVTTGPSLHPVFSVAIFIHHTSHLTWLLSRCYHWAQSPPCLLCGHLYSSHFPSHLIMRILGPHKLGIPKQ